MAFRLRYPPQRRHCAPQNRECLPVLEVSRPHTHTGVYWASGPNCTKCGPQTCARWRTGCYWSAMRQAQKPRARNIYSNLPLPQNQKHVHWTGYRVGWDSCCGVGRSIGCEPDLCRGVRICVRWTTDNTRQKSSPAPRRSVVSQGSAHFFWKGPDGTYFRLWRTQMTSILYSWFPFLFYEPLKMEQQCSARGLYHHKRRLDLAQTQWCAEPQFQRVSATQSWVEKQGTCFQLSDK